MISETAKIHPSAKIDKSAEIGHCAVIGENTIIGPGTVIGAHSIIEYAEIGKNCKISSHATIGTPPQDLKYNNEPTKIVIGDNCKIREFVTLNRGTTASGKTVIGNNCLLMAYVHLAHDSVLGNNVICANCTNIAGHVEVGDNVVFGALTGIHQFVKIGKLAMLAGGSVVTQDILPFTQCFGNRARLVGLNLVGMKRKPLSQQSIEEIKAAYRILFLSGIPMEEALDQLEASKPGPEVREMIDFIHSSKRGIIRPNRKENPEEL
ncbi:acyl-ACP--UDP-N-acetylglucosamine O-acyltransferase [Elusimicrobiota bacterium]